MQVKHYLKSHIVSKIRCSPTTEVVQDQFGVALRDWHYWFLSNQRPGNLLVHATQAGGLSNGFDDQPMALEKHLMPEKPDPRLTKYRLDQKGLDSAWSGLTDAKFTSIAPSERHTAR